MSEPVFDSLFGDDSELELLDVCDYCGKSGKQIAIDVTVLASSILEQVKKEYADPAEELPYETREGGYQGNVIDNPWDLFEEIEFEFKHSELMSDVCDCLAGEVWLCRSDYFGLRPHERLQYGWDRFCDVVKHQRRYTFWSAHDEEIGKFDLDHLPTSRVLAEVAGTITTVGLTKSLALGLRIWRARVHSSGDSLSTAADFSSPPTEFATYSNRMSPAGISMFYGADTVDTAVAEVVGQSGLAANKVVSVASFVPKKQIRVLDLADLPEVPSFFDSRDTLRQSLYFLIRFSRDVSLPIQKDGSEHVEYVPTQAFADFIRYEVKTPTGKSIDGIRYKSSIHQGTCYAIFADHEACLAEPLEAWRPHSPLLTFEAESVVAFSSSEVSRLLTTNSDA